MYQNTYASEQRNKQSSKYAIIHKYCVRLIFCESVPKSTKGLLHKLSVDQSLSVVTVYPKYIGFIHCFNRLLKNFQTTDDIELNEDYLVHFLDDQYSVTDLSCDPKSVGRST